MSARARHSHGGAVRDLGSGGETVGRARNEKGGDGPPSVFKVSARVFSGCEPPRPQPTSLIEFSLLAFFVHSTSPPHLNHLSQLRGCSAVVCRWTLSQPRLVFMPTRQARSPKGKGQVLSSPVSCEATALFPKAAASQSRPRHRLSQRLCGTAKAAENPTRHHPALEMKNGERQQQAAGTNGRRDGQARE